jgi:hypothetical protein
MDQQTIRGQSRAVVAGIAGNVMEWYDFSDAGVIGPDSADRRIV